MGYIGQVPTAIPLTSADITDGTIALADMAVNSIDSDQYVDGSIDNAHLADDAVGVAELSATGTADATTFLRGDNSWQTAGGLTGVTTGSGNVTITSGNLILASGNGIDFSATADGTTMASELLDDYEEGVCTATITTQNGTQALNVSYNYLHYTKIGRTVQLQGYLYGGANSSTSGWVNLNGLPFVCMNLAATSYPMMHMGWAEGWTATYANKPLAGYSYDNLAYFKVFANGVLYCADGLQAGAAFYVGGVYMA